MCVDTCDMLFVHTHTFKDVYYSIIYKIVNDLYSPFKKIES